MTQPQATGPRDVFHGAHNVEWERDDAIYVLEARPQDKAMDAHQCRNVPTQGDTTMKNPPRHHFGKHTPKEAAMSYGKHQVKASLPDGLRDRIPSPEAVRDAIQDAPHAGDLPEPMGKCIESYTLRMPSFVYEVFEEKRDELARGAYLRRIIHWRWGT